MQVGCLAGGLESGDPAVGALPGDPEFFGDVRDRSLLAAHAVDQE